MTAYYDCAEMLRVCNGHKAKTLTKLEGLNCPDDLLDIVQVGFAHLQSDLVEMSDRSIKRQRDRTEAGLEGKR